MRISDWSSDVCSSDLTDRNDINGDRTEVGDQRIPYIYELAPGGFVPTITIDPRFDLNNHDLFWDDARLRRDESKRRNEIIAGRFDAAYELDGFPRRSDERRGGKECVRK